MLGTERINNEEKTNVYSSNLENTEISDGTFNSMIFPGTDFNKNIDAEIPISSNKNINKNISIDTINNLLKNDNTNSDLDGVLSNSVNSASPLE